MRVERLFSRPACQLGSLAPVAKEPIESGEGVGGRAEEEVLRAAAGVRPAAQVGGGLGGARLPPGVDALGLDVLGGVLPDGFDLVQAARGSGLILGGNGDPMEGNLFQRLGEAGDAGHVLQAGGASLAGVDVEHLHAAAIGADVDMVAVEGQILGGGARRQRIHGRSLLEGVFDEARLGFDDHFGAVNRCAVRLPDVERTRRGEAHADMRDEVQGGVVEAADFLGGEDAQRELGVGDGFDGGGHR